MGLAIQNNSKEIRGLSVEINTIHHLNDRTLRHIRHLKNSTTEREIYEGVQLAHAEMNTKNSAAYNMEFTVPAAQASLKWEDMVQDYYSTPTVEPAVRSIRDDVHHFRAIGMVTTSTGHIHLHVPYNFSQFLQHALMCCECYETLLTDLGKATANYTGTVPPHVAHLKGHLNLPVFKYACAEAKSDVFDLMQMFHFEVDEPTWDLEGHSLFRKYMQNDTEEELQSDRAPIADRVGRENRIAKNRFGEEFRHMIGRGLHRGKRQLLAGAAALIGTVAAGVAGFSLKSYFSGNPADRNTQIVHKLNSHSHDLQIIEHHEKLLAQTMNSLRYDTELMARAEQKAYFAHKIDVCQIQSMTMRVHMDKVLRALRALYKHELPYEFLNLHTFEKNLPQLEEALYKRKLRLISNKPSDVLNLKTSWASQKGQLSVFIHVPVSPIRPLPLYKFLPTPFYSKTLQSYYIYDIEDKYLAYSNETMAFRAFPSLEDCTEVHNGLFTCIGHNVLSTNHSTSCLMAIYNGNAEVAYQLCKIKQFLEPSKSFQLGPNNFAFFSRSATVGNFECVGSQKFQTNDRLTGILRERKMESGVSLIQVPNHCSYHTSGLVINSEEITMMAPLLSMPIAPQFRDTLAWAHILDSHRMAALAKKDPTFPVDSDVDLTDMNLPEDDLKPILTKWYEYPAKEWEWYTWVLLALAFAAITAFGVWAYLRFLKRVAPASTTTVVVNPPPASSEVEQAREAWVELTPPAPPPPRQQVHAHHGLGRGSSLDGVGRGSRSREPVGIGRGNSRGNKSRLRPSRPDGEYDQARHLNPVRMEEFENQHNGTRQLVRDYVDRAFAPHRHLLEQAELNSSGNRRPVTTKDGEYMELLGNPTDRSRPTAAPRQGQASSDVDNEYLAPSAPRPVSVEDELRM